METAPQLNVPVLDNSFPEEAVLNIQSKPTLTQLKSISSHSVMLPGKESDPHITTASFQGIVGSNKVTPDPPLNISSSFKPLLTRRVLQNLYQLCCPLS